MKAGCAGVLSSPIHTCAGSTRHNCTCARIGLGCMLVTSAVNTSSPKVRKMLTACRAGAEAGLRKRIERGIREG